MLIKICGITTEEAFDATVESGADLMGFVFFHHSPRHLSWREARKFGERSAGNTKKVAVVVSHNLDELEVITEFLKPDVIQLHSSDANAVKVKFDLPLIQAFNIGEEDDLYKLKCYDKDVDYFLFDSKSYVNDAYVQPSKPFDWRWLREFRRPHFISGGLTASNVGNAIKVANTYCRGVDVSSGVEESLGIKSPEKIKQFVQKVRKVTPKLKGERHAEPEEAYDW